MIGNVHEDHTARVGDTFLRQLRLFDSTTGKARDLTGARLYSAIRYGATDDADAAPQAFAMSVSNPANGIVDAELPRDHQLPAGVYCFEIDVAYASGVRETINNGTLTVLPSLF